MTVPWTVQSSRERVSSHGSLDSWRDTTLKAREGFGHIHLTCSFLFCGVRCGGAAGLLANYRPTRGGERTGTILRDAEPEPPTPNAQSKAWAKDMPHKNRET